ncbi:hypothetical protein A9Z07_17045 [Acinetobacter sp. YK3]|nr:hypothetical protein A9Z07_17045 [Acinetobacter sp. YK3]
MILMRFQVLLGIFTSIIVMSNVEAKNAEEILDSFSGSGSMTMLTDYYLHGFSQTNNNPAIQGSFRVDHKSGLYGQIFASNANLGSSGSLELNYMIGYQHKFNENFTTDLKYVKIRYPGLDVGELPTANFDVFAASLLISNIFNNNELLRFSNFYSPKYSFDSGKAASYEVNYTQPITDNLNFYAQYAYNKFSNKENYAKAFGNDEKDSYYDYRIGGNMSYNNFIFDLSYVNSNIAMAQNQIKLSESKVIFGITKLF